MASSAFGFESCYNQWSFDIPRGAVVARDL
jgi:hypothetical protein